MVVNERSDIVLFTYPAIIHNDNDGMWLEFVDFNCYTYADTLNELLYNAKKAMECHILGLLECGEKLPIASTLDKPNYTFIQCYIDLD